MSMKIYRWHSEALKAYRTGDILALGETVEEAREAARAHFPTIVMERWVDMLGYIADGSWEMSEEDIEDRDEKLRLLEEDIRAEPEVSDAFFIPGGE